MNAVTRAINVALPDALQTHQHVALKLRTHFLQLVSKPDCRRWAQMRDRSKWPFVARPIGRRDELGLVAKIDNPVRQPFQISFRAAARRIATAHESDGEFAVRHFRLTNLVIPSEVEESLNIRRGGSPNRSEPDWHLRASPSRTGKVNRPYLQK
jgi:hypothetical protein